MSTYEGKKVYEVHEEEYTWPQIQEKRKDQYNEEDLNTITLKGLGTPECLLKITNEADLKLTVERCSPQGRAVGNGRSSPRGRRCRSGTTTSASSAGRTR